MTRNWRIGREFIVRHAGMPFDWLEELGAPGDLLELADEVVRREDVLLASVSTHFTGDRATGIRADVLHGRIDQLPRTAGPDWQAAVDAWGEALAQYVRAYQAADEQVGKELREVLATSQVSEAVFLSNPDVYRNMLQPFLAYQGALNSRWRRVRRQMYTYVQRFCAKNETVSFFGPMAYGTVGGGDDAQLRRDVPRTRRVFLSHWAARALALAIARDSAILPHLRFHHTGRGADPGEPILAQVLPGGTTVRQLIQRSGRPAVEVVRTLMKLVATEHLTIGLGGGDYDLDPLTTLREQLAALPATPARDQWIARLGDLAALLTELGEQPLDRKITTVAAVETRFTEITGKPARRGAGAAYADRAVFFEECASPFALTIGADLIRRWEEQLTPLLEACVTHGHATQTAAAEAVRESFAGNGQDRELNLLEYATRAAADQSDSTSTYQATYAPSYPGEDWRSELAQLIDRANALDGERYAVIDLCPAATDVAGLDEAPLVLSRAHHHLLVNSWLATMHPDPRRYGAAATEWVARQADDLVGLDLGRRNKGYYRFPGREVAMRPLSWTDEGRADLLKPEDLRVSITADTVTLRDPDGRTVTAYVPLSDFVKYAPIAALSHPQVLHPTFRAATGGALPEVVLGAVTLQRARWRVPTQTLAAAEPHTRFLGLRRLARDTNVRFLFGRSAHERKPYLIDLASPLAADLVNHITRGCDEIDVERMAPGPEGLWLRDAEGRRYTSELRMQVVGEGGTA